jgi:hypothetical protein
MENVMFQKIPYGLKVRVRGSEDTGYRADICYGYNRFFPFLNIWTDLARYNYGLPTVAFKTMDEATEVAMTEYNRAISYYVQKEEKDKQLKKVSKRTVWEHP